MGKFIKLVISILFVVTIIGMIVYVNLHAQQANIFDEIYMNMDKVTLPKKLIRKTYSNFNANEKEYPVVQLTYEDNISSNYKNIFFEKNTRDRSLDICFTKELDKKVQLKMWYIYNLNEHKAKKELVIIDNQAGEEHYIDKSSKIKSYLDRYHITSHQIAQSYRRVIQNLILKDWTKIYNSKFTTSDYNKIPVQTKWED